MPLDYPFKIQRTEVLLQDKLLNLDEITLMQDSTVFKMVVGESRPENRIPGLVTLLSFEMDLNKYIISRTSYNILDMFSNIGGITVLFLRYFTVFVAVFNFKNMENNLVSQLYKLIDKDNEKTEKPAVKNMSRSFKEYLLDLLPKQVTCCWNKS